jgi:hypothetical protein
MAVQDGLLCINWMNILREKMVRPSCAVDCTRGAKFVKATTSALLTELMSIYMN